MINNMDLETRSWLEEIDKRLDRLEEFEHKHSPRDASVDTRANGKATWGVAGSEEHLKGDGK